MIKLQFTLTLRKEVYRNHPFGVKPNIGYLRFFSIAIP